jgi:nitroimidazol reductase NimA-like FMN-containing flavoprotein (pyridoxamine 5'-phosphate oxidase superfamily)
MKNSEFTEDAALLYDVMLIADVMMYHVRRKDKEITDPSAMKNVLKSTKCVTIALCKDNEPYLVTLTHGYDENRNCIYFHCAKEGKKIDYMKTSSKVWGQAFIDHGYVQGECDHHYTSVHFSGKVTFLEDLAEKKQAMECMMRHLERKSEEMIAKLKPERFQSATIGRVDIDYMSGKTSNKPAK